MRRVCLSLLPWLTLASLLAAVPAAATSMLPRNLLELTDLARTIVVGRVLEVSDGIADGWPYTEVRVEVTETVKGTAGGVVTFRQFGLLAPRRTENGLVNLAVTPPGWPRYRAGEQTVLFLWEPAARTGLQTTVGLMQGKFTIDRGKIRNAIDNRGLFARMRQPRAATASDRALLETHGPVDLQPFLGFVRRAVSNGWTP